MCATEKNLVRIEQMNYFMFENNCLDQFELLGTFRCVYVLGCVVLNLKIVNISIRSVRVMSD